MELDSEQGGRVLSRSDLRAIRGEAYGWDWDLMRKKSRMETRQRESAVVLREWGREKAMPWDFTTGPPFVKCHCL